MFLPGARGFDTYLGTVASADQGSAKRSPCPGDNVQACPEPTKLLSASDYRYTLADNVHGTVENLAALNAAKESMLPLVFQSGGTHALAKQDWNTRVHNTCHLIEWLTYDTFHCVLYK